MDDAIEQLRPDRPHPRERRKIERYSRLTLFGRRWFFRARGANGEIVATGEPYSSPEARDRGIDAARAVFGVGRVIDL